ncbi:unnamed protein product, partial [Vitis vinifera]
MVQLQLSKIRVRVGLAGLSVLLERWKVLTSLQLGTLLALASNSLWSVITSAIQRKWVHVTLDAMVG